MLLQISEVSEFTWITQIKISFNMKFVIVFAAVFAVSSAAILPFSRTAPAFPAFPAARTGTAFQPLRPVAVAPTTARPVAVVPVVRTAAIPAARTADQEAYTVSKQASIAPDQSQYSYAIETSNGIAASEQGTLSQPRTSAETAAYATQGSL